MKLTNNSIYILKRICYNIPCEYKLTGEECIEAFGMFKPTLKGRWIAFKANKNNPP